MKKIYFSLSFVAAIIALLGCYKKFDSNSYKPAFEISGYTSASEIAPSNLVAYWSFDKDYNEAKTGTAFSGVNTSFSPGIKNNGFKGSGAAYVIGNMPSVVANLKSFTLTYWINTPINTNGIVGTMNFSRTDDFWGNVDMFYENGSTPTQTTFKMHINNNNNGAWVVFNIPNPWDTWMHVALTYDQTTSTFVAYVNGSKVTESTIANYGPIQFQNATKIIFGTVQFQTTPSLGTAGGPQGWASYLQGTMDEARIYDKALSATEINALQVLESKGK